MDTILVRYCEIGLKSDPVRRRFETILEQNMVSMLAADSVEAVVKRGNARFYVETEEGFRYRIDVRRRSHIPHS